jgi:MYXO-CTERM domain-containing protein
MFCNGQYVDTNGNAQGCMDALVALFPTIKFSGSASGSCSGNTCQAQAEGKASCAMSEQPTDSSGMAAALAGLAGLTVVARRRRRA